LYNRRRALIAGFLLASTFPLISLAGSPRFRRGDVNGSGNIDISDPVGIVLHLFLGEGPPGCLDAADVDDSGVLDLSDAISLIEFLFMGGPAFPAPYPSCGEDPTVDGLDCESFGNPPLCPQATGNPCEVVGRAAERGCGPHLPVGRLERPR